MKAMILAAGRGMRMMPLTADKPKCLLTVGDKPLISYLLTALANNGFTEIVINVSYRREAIQQMLGDGSAFGLSIRYSIEETALETGGGIRHALPLLGTEPFMIVNSDVWTDFPFARLRALSPQHAHLVLVPNPTHCPQGDFQLGTEGILSLAENERYTYAGIGVYHPQLFRHFQQTQFRLTDVLLPAIEKGEITGELYTQGWLDVGTPQRLQQLQQQMSH